MILLDTHVLLWHERGDRMLGAQARRTFERSLMEGDAAVSAISFWEIGMQVQKGRIELMVALEAWRRDLLDRGLVEIPVDGAVTARAGLLADMHGDPADRIIVATALEGHSLLTADPLILRWPGKLTSLNARS